MLDLLDEARRPEQRDPGFAPAAEVVHMGVGDEDVREPQDLARRKSPDVTEIEPQCPAFEREVDEQTRVAEEIVDQARLEDRSHSTGRKSLCAAWSAQGGAFGREALFRACAQFSCVAPAHYFPPTQHPAR